VPDAHKSWWQDMQEEASQKLFHGQTHHALFVAMLRIAPPECHLPVGEFHQPMIGNGNPVDVIAQILQHVFGPAEGPFGVHHPVLSMALAQKIFEVDHAHVWWDAGRKPQLAGLEGFPQCGCEFATKDSPQHLHWQEEVVSRPHPMLAIGSKTAFRDHTMNVRVVLEFLIPGVQHAEEADLGAEMARISSHLEQSFGASSEQQPVDCLLVEQRQHGQLMRQGEDYMGISHRQ
jgi:hypothetical protein